MQALVGVAGVKRDGLDAHHVAVNHRHHGKPAVQESLGIAGAQDDPWRLLDKAGRVVDQGLANGGNQRVIGKDGANFLFGDVHRFR